MTEVIRERILLIRLNDTLFGVAQAAVRDVIRPQGRVARYRVRLADEELAVDELVGVVDDLPVWPPGGVMARYWSEPAGGLTVHSQVPMVVVDPARPPSFLRSEEETERPDGDDR